MTRYFKKGLIECESFLIQTIILIFGQYYIALIAVKILLCFSLKHKRLKRIAGIASNKN